MKTRSLFEISKGSFKDSEKSVNSRVAPEALWAPFENMIYIGDGYTDVPAFSVVRKNGGMGVAVYDPSKTTNAINKKVERLRLDKRTDLITEANFDLSGELYDFLRMRCRQIAFRYLSEMPL